MLLCRTDEAVRRHTLLPLGIVLMHCRLEFLIRDARLCIVAFNTTRSHGFRTWRETSPNDSVSNVTLLGSFISISRGFRPLKASLTSSLASAGQAHSLSYNRSKKPTSCDLVAFHALQPDLRIPRDRTLPGKDQSSVDERSGRADEPEDKARNR